MANNLQSKLDAIKLEKDTKLLSSNLKAGVTVLGVTGTLESGIDTSDATATSNDISMNKTAYVNGNKITGDVPVEDAKYTKNASNIQYLSEESLIKAKASTDSKVTLFQDVDIEMLMEDEQVAQAIDLKSNMIRKGYNVLGINGTYEGESNSSGGLDTSDATATRNDIAYGKTAYVNGVKVNGNLTDYRAYEKGRPIGSNGLEEIGNSSALYKIIPKDEENGILGDSLQIITNSSFGDGIANKWYINLDNLRSWAGIRADRIPKGTEILGIQGTNYGFKTHLCPSKCNLIVNKLSSVDSLDSELDMNSIQFFNDWNFAEQYGMTLNDMRKTIAPYTVICLTYEGDLSSENPAWISATVSMTFAPCESLLSYDNSYVSVNGPMMSGNIISSQVGGMVMNDGTADWNTIINELLDYMKYGSYPQHIQIDMPYTQVDNNSSSVNIWASSEFALYTNYDINDIHIW